MKAHVKTIIGKFIIGVLILNGFTGFALLPTQVRAQDRAIIINADQPNVWTLEQAHYLLAQMHRRNLDLKAKSLEDLDANEINGLRFEVLRTLIELGVKFDQADLAANKLISQNQNFNTERRQSLLARRDKLRADSLNLSGEISQLESDKANADNDDDKDKLDKQIASKTALRAKVDKEIEQIDSELESLPAPSGNLTATKAEATFEPNKLPKSDAFDQAFKDAVAAQIKSFNEAPKLNATLRLENFLQMQYEIIAKQLTLLRDEVGPGERLLFLELPQTVNTTYGEANKKWAQSWWKIAGYTRRERPEQKNTKADAKDTKAVATPTPLRPSENRRPITTSQDYDSLLYNKEISLYDEKTKSETQEQRISFTNKFINLDNEEKEEFIKNDELLKYLRDNKATLSSRRVRTVELIPRQSSLNVNDMKLKTSAGAFSFIGSFLFGFGASLKMQRQREQFSQFVQQELYSSAFGKGAREFGWTFMPMPGTDRIMSGVKTTYAVLVVPEEATSIILESNGCFFPRSEYQPVNFAETKKLGERWGNSSKSRGCGTATKAFVVPIPSASIGGNNDFWVEGISYQPVDKGKRIVVLISGKNFSSQMGVLINGVPLIHAIGLAQPLIRDDSKVFEATNKDFEKEPIQGRIERVDSNKIVFSFKMPDDFEETPTITLIAPGKAVDINWFDDIFINGKFPATLLPKHDKDCKKIPVPANCVNIASPMFKGDPDPVTPTFKIDVIEAFRGDDGKISIVITGVGFEAGTAATPGTKIFVNGIEQTAANLVRSKSLIVVNNIDALSNDKIQVTLTSGDKTIKSASIANPAFLKIDKVTVVSYEAASGKKPAVLIVKIEGAGFPGGLMSPDKKVKVTVTSSSEAFLRIEDPDVAEIVTLKDPVTNISVNTVVTRKPPK